MKINIRKIISLTLSLVLAVSVCLSVSAEGYKDNNFGGEDTIQGVEFKAGKFALNEDIIYKIPAGTTVSEVCFETNGTEVKNGEEKLLGDNFLKTGEMTYLYDSIEGITHERKISILGDVSGDGVVSVTDVVSTRGEIITPGTLSDVQIASANIVDTDAVTVTDVVGVRNMILSSDNFSAETPDASVLQKMEEDTETNAQNLSVTDEMLINSVTSDGNRVRLANVFRKAMAGEDICIVTLGGSLTFGSNAGAEDCYARRVGDWFQNMFPDINVEFHNVGISATNSEFGVYRMTEDVLAHNPDFTIVEYAVNDNDSTYNYYLETYEGVIRRLLDTDSAVLLYMMCAQLGNTSEEYKVPIGKYYELPIVSYKNGYFTADFWNSHYVGDDVHPTKDGHARMSLQITEYLRTVYKDLGSIGYTHTETPKPMTEVGGLYSNARIIKMDEIDTLSDVELISAGSFTADSSVTGIEGGRTFLGYTATSGKEPLKISVKNCHTVAVLLVNPNATSGYLTAKVNGGTEVAIGKGHSNPRNVTVWTSSDAQDATIELIPYCEEGPVKFLAIMVS